MSGNNYIHVNEIATMDLTEIAELNEEVRNLMDYNYPEISPDSKVKNPEEDLPF